MLPSFLYRIGWFCARYAKSVVAVWLAAFGLGRFAAQSLPALLFSGSGDMSERVSLRFDTLLRTEFAHPRAQLVALAVITSAALIMAVVFGAFSFARVVLVQMLDLGLAVAVMADATLIRMLLGPALMQVAGNWNWWPLRLTPFPEPIRGV
jgi:uncharacterized membrane protein YdfJ with MMPL/SSD domain